ncbi:nucleoside 2-deoxyribosyltransferase [Lacticaseibacillus paracasei]|uniref:nucleoside 2-deoxyribosyltransferase n=1 Tax=Lacticaseibacillus paracasei TaxID=1597 RepID=UPI0007BFB01A|nr:nucleoside 2-deoxyribosyltransferase [Lacticaseibacillus paracasei]URW91250.1 nucleoside 2-deoxyribosyltransferase [Lacticaseibacillus paracasei]
MTRQESIYIAGPEVFFNNGDEVLKAMRILAESRGHSVTLPNDDPLEMNHTDRRLNAQSIFKNLLKVMNNTSLIIADLDQFRGSEPDSGTIFELGMAYARKIRTYGFARDTRPLAWKDQKIVKKDSELLDENGKVHHYSFLPFSPLVMASTQIVEGNFEQALIQTELDAYRIREEIELPKKDKSKLNKPTIFVALRDYYDSESVKKAQESLRKQHNSAFDFEFPYFRNLTDGESINSWLEELLFENTKRINKAEVFVADLNNFRGDECSNDVGFLSGYAFTQGKSMFGYMNDTRPMIKKIPNTKKCGKFKDIAERDVENFDYPINLMFACAMQIIEGDLMDWQTAFILGRAHK